MRVAAVGFPDTPLKREQVDALPYATLQARIGKGPRSLLVLAEKDGAELRWLSADKAMLVTRHGRIVKTAGLDNDLSGTSLLQDELLGRPAALAGGTLTRQIDLQSQFRYGTLVTSTFAVVEQETIEILGRTHATVRLVESGVSPQLDWRFTNTWWVDAETGFVWKSLQAVTPEMPVFELAVLKPAA